MEAAAGDIMSSESAQIELFDSVKTVGKELGNQVSEYKNAERKLRELGRGDVAFESAEERLEYESARKRSGRRCRRSNVTS